MTQIKPLMHVASPLGRRKEDPGRSSKELLKATGRTGKRLLLLPEAGGKGNLCYVLAENTVTDAWCAMTAEYGPDETVNLHESSRKSVSSASWLFLAMYDKILYKSRKETTEELFHFLAEIRENIGSRAY